MSVIRFLGSSTKINLKTGEKGTAVTNILMFATGIPFSRLLHCLFLSYLWKYSDFRWES